VEFSALYGPALDFLRRHAGRDVLVVAMERQAADHIVRGMAGSHAGVRRYSLRQLITALAAPAVAERGQRPITSLIAGALAAQVIAKVDAPYYRPVANTPGFPTALVETLTRLRLDERDPASADLLALSDAYAAALEENKFADAADQCKAAITVTESGREHPLLGLPTLLIDTRAENAREARFLECLSARAETAHSISSERGLGRVFPDQLAALRTQLFAETVTSPQMQEGVEFFVAVGTPVSRRPPHRSVRAELLHTAPTFDEWRRSAHSDADAGSSHLESIDQPTARTVPKSSCLAGSVAEAHGTIAR
jgi:hypothetical protein